MLIEQAKKFFCDFNGYKFHMAREEPGLMMEYDELKIPHETEAEWRQEILDELENKYYEYYNKRRDCCWCAFWDFLKVSEKTDTDCGKNGERLLKMLNHAAENLDPRQKILIMEEIPSVISWICARKELKENLAPLINKLIDFDPPPPCDKHGWKDPRERYDNALGEIKTAYYIVYVKEKY